MKALSCNDFLIRCKLFCMHVYSLEAKLLETLHDLNLETPRFKGTVRDFVLKMFLLLAQIMYILPSITPLLFG